MQQSVFSGNGTKPRLTHITPLKRCFACITYIGDKGKQSWTISFVLGNGRGFYAPAMAPAVYYAITIAKLIAIYFAISKQCARYSAQFWVVAPQKICLAFLRFRIIIILTRGNQVSH